MPWDLSDTNQGLTCADMVQKGFFQPSWERLQFSPTTSARTLLQRHSLLSYLSCASSMLKPSSPTRLFKARCTSLLSSPITSSPFQPVNSVQLVCWNYSKRNKTWQYTNNSMCLILLTLYSKLVVFLHLDQLLAMPLQLSTGALI